MKFREESPAVSFVCCTSQDLKCILSKIAISTITVTTKMGNNNKAINCDAFHIQDTNLKTMHLNAMFVYISDIQPPTFVSCPEQPLLRYAERDKFTALVNWTTPVVTDNSGVAPTVTSNYGSPQKFSQGTHAITYIAVDQSGNKATCTFTVKVTGMRVLKLVYSYSEGKVQAVNISVTSMCVICLSGCRYYQLNMALIFI